jgi:Tol biopolymer transport system component
MKKCIFIFMFSAICIYGQLINAQPKISGKAEILISMPEKICMNAKWSPDRKQIAFTSEHHNGLWKYDTNSRQISQITNDLSAGFGYSWSADARNILARPLIIDNSLKYYMVKVYETGTGKEKVIVDRSRSISGLPVWSAQDSKIAVILDKEVKLFESGKPVLKNTGSVNTKPVNFSENLIPAGQQAKKEIKFAEFKNRHIFNSRVSPKGDKVVFQVNGLGLYVSNTDGSQLKHLGFGEQATWMPDGKYIVVTQVKDNGQAITEGSLFAVNTETGQYFSLFTDPQIIALKPCVSPDGSKLLFDNLNNGAIYCIKLNQ